MTTSERDLTHGDVWKQIFAYAMPIVMTSLLQTVYNMTDTIIAGRFVGSAAVSAISNSSQILNILMNIAVGLTTGGHIVIGQFFGAKDESKLSAASGTLVTLSMLCGIGTALALLFGATPILKLMGAPAMGPAVAYLRICAVGMIFIFGYNALSAVMRGVGDSRTPLLITTVSLSVNLVLDIIFVAAMHMGTAGSALATTIAQGISFVLAVYFTAKRTGLMQMKASFFRIDRPILRLTLRMGVPSALQQSIAGVSWLVVTAIINGYGVDASAAYGVAVRIREIAQLFIAAMSNALTTIIAQNLGACQYERSKKIMYSGMKLTVGVTLGIIAAVELFSPQMVSVFTAEAAVREIAVMNLRIEIMGQLFYALFMTYHAMAIGAGHSSFAMVSSFVNCIIFRVLLSLLFNRLFGICGVYLACAVAPASSVPLGMLYVRSGVWKRSLCSLQESQHENA